MDNELIFTDHIACAACETPLCPDTAGAFFGSPAAVEAALQRLRARSVLVQAGDEARCRANAWVRNPLTVTAPEPWSRVSLRAIGDQFSVVDDGRGGACIDTLDARRAFFKVGLRTDFDFVGDVDWATHPAVLMRTLLLCADV